MYSNSPQLAVEKLGLILDYLHCEDTMDSSNPS
jgi:hypothetical protein